MICKSAAFALLSAVVSLLLKKHNPELALLLGAATALGILIAAMGVLNGLREFRSQIERIMGGIEPSITPVLKCLVISITTKITSELCRDSSQNAAAAAVEMAGAFCALAAVLPLLMSVMEMVGGLV